MPQKILYIHPSNELYGADRSLLRLVQALDKKQYQPIVIVANDIPYKEKRLTNELDKANIAFQARKLGVMRRRYLTPIGALQFFYQTISSAIHLAHYCRQHNISLIHTNSSAIISGGWAAKLAGIPHIWHMREIIQKPRLLNKFIANNMAAFATSVVAVSTPVKNNLLIAQPRLQNKLQVIYNGIDTYKFDKTTENVRKTIRDRWQIPEESLVIGMIGRISEWKGQDFLLDAMKQIVHLHPTARLILVGGNVPGEEWRLQKLQTKIADLQLEQHVHIEQFSLEIPKILAGFDIFVLPSTKPDPFPTVVLEAMAAGKAIVATNHGGPTEQLVPQVSGLLVSPTDVQEMVMALHQLLKDPNMRKTFGQSAQQRARQYFTTTTYATNIMQLYQRII